MSENKSQFQTMLAGIALGMVLLLVYVAAMGMAPAPLKAPVIVDSLVLHPSGADDTKALQALYDGALDGDTIRLVPQNGNKRFIISSSLNWTGTKSVNVYAVGAVLYSDMALSGTQAMVTWGAPLGSRNTGILRWTGGEIWGSLAVQNVSYSRIEPDKCITLILQGDLVCAYDHVVCPGGFNGSTGNGSGLIFNALAPGAWFNKNTFYTCPIIGSYGAAAIWEVNQTDRQYPPSANVFYSSDTEFDGPFLNVGPGFNFIDNERYVEGACTGGTYGAGANITAGNPCHGYFDLPNGMIYSYGAKQ